MELPVFANPVTYGEQKGYGLQIYIIRIPFAVVLKVYVKKEEEKAYHVVMLDALTAYDFKIEVCQHLFEVAINSVLLQLAKIFDIPIDLVSGLYKKTKKGYVCSKVSENI